MNLGPGFEKQQRLVSEIICFLKSAHGLSAAVFEEARFCVRQNKDSKSITIDGREIEDVIFRSDVTGDEFIQVNFRSGRKILLTKTLIGFKPTPGRGLEAAKIPRVVTTPDILNVFEAIQDAVHLHGQDSEDVLLLKKVFESVLSGGEAVGFDLSMERAWMLRLSASQSKISS